MATVSRNEVLATAQAFGYKVREDQVEHYQILLDNTRKALAEIEAIDDYQPVPDLQASQRREICFPDEVDNTLGAWAWRCTCMHSRPISTLLKGKTVCFKDNIAMAGVPCLLGTDSFTQWTPKTDATVVTRVLDAGGIITGKAVCENLSRGAVSITAATGPVHNPYRRGYNAGGSSSGAAALVGSGAVDMGIGCDQGGSIRIPASLCGAYGFKPTVGLVPYTGIASNDASVDFVGPITQTCMDNALLLEAIAGVDDLDDRQIAGTPFRNDVPKYSEILTNSTGIKGLRIGILKEGLTSEDLYGEVEEKFRAAADVFAQLGAIVEEVSVPLHEQAKTLYTIMSKMGNHMGMLGKATGRRQVMLTDLFAKKNLPYSQDAYDKMSTMTIEGLLSGQYAWDHAPLAYPKSINISRKLKHAYNSALQKYDVLIMPTTIRPADPLPPVNPDPIVYAAKAVGKLENTCSFNATGHPALAMPIGFVPAVDDESLKVPTSMQIVGKFWDEATILRIAYAWEKEVDWKNF